MPSFTTIFAHLSELLSELINISHQQWADPLNQEPEAFQEGIGAEDQHLEIYEKKAKAVSFAYW